MMALVIASQTTAVAQAPSPVSALVLKPGDIVRITVWRKPEFSGDQLVAADGTLKHPLYREVTVGGLTVTAARERIAGYLKAFETNPQISIEPLFRVSIGGEVRNPNLYNLPPETTISQAIAQAGGPGERGRIDRVTLIRDGRESLLDLRAPGAAAVLAPVASGDQLLVGRRVSAFRDYFVPVITTLGSVAAIAGLFRNLR